MVQRHKKRNASAAFRFILVFIILFETSFNKHQRTVGQRSHSAADHIEHRIVACTLHMDLQYDITQEFVYLPKSRTGYCEESGKEKLYREIVRKSAFFQDIANDYHAAFRKEKSAEKVQPSVEEFSVSVKIDNRAERRRKNIEDHSDNIEFKRESPKESRQNKN